MLPSLTVLRFAASPARILPAISVRSASTSTVPSPDAAGTDTETAAPPTESVGEMRIKAIKLYKEVSYSVSAEGPN